MRLGFGLVAAAAVLAGCGGDTVGPVATSVSGLTAGSAPAGELEIDTPDGALTYNYTPPSGGAPEVYQFIRNGVEVTGTDFDGLRHDPVLTGFRAYSDDPTNASIPSFLIYLARHVRRQRVRGRCARSKAW